MNKKLNNMIRQLSESEQKLLSDYIERQYAVKFKGEGMLRDDIVYKVTELLHIEFTQIDAINVNEGSDLQSDLELDAVDITGFAEILLREFELESIAFSNIIEWTTISDIIDTIEDTLECALHDMES